MMIRSVLALACLAAIATAAPVNEDAGMAARLAPGATAGLEQMDLSESTATDATLTSRQTDMADLGLEQVDLSESVASTAQWGHRRRTPRRTLYARRRRRRTFYARRRRAPLRRRRSCAKKNGSTWSGYGAWGNWQYGAWSTCNGNGDVWRYRYRASYRSCGGASCGGTNWCNGSRSRSDTSQHHSNIKVNCAQSAWSAWSACTKTCGSGSQKRTRSTTTAASCGGSACAHAAETQACNAQACPVDCGVSNFGGAYTACTKSCGGGSQHRTRSLIAPKHGGKACPASKQSRSCGNGPCPIHCATSAFTAWSACTKSCGKGAQSRKRSITTRNLHGGYVCPYLAETRVCNDQPCAVDGGWTAFSAWAACSKSCDSGMTTRTRTCTSPAPMFGGKPCPQRFTFNRFTFNHAKETKNCNTQVCNCPTCSFKDGHVVVGHTSEHSLTATHGPRDVHASCANRAQKAFCGKTFVISHKCTYNRETGMCACVCRKPTTGQARDHHVIRFPSHKQTNGKVVKNSKLANSPGAAPMWTNPAVVVNKN